MPEGHSVHRIADRFAQILTGAPLVVTSPQGRFAAGAARLDGAEMLSCTAVGKQLFAAFSNDLTLRVHLGLYGAWDVYTRDGAQTGPGSMGAPRRLRAGEGEAELETASAAWPPDPIGAVRVRLLSDTVCADLRGPSACETLTAAEVAAQLAKLGPDPLVDRGRAGHERFAARASRTRTAIGALLMDQSAIAGIGNIYRAELLFRAGLSPYAPANSLTEEELADLWRDWGTLLRRGIRDGVIMTRELSGAARRRALESEETRHWVYGRAGQPCRRCRTPILIADMQGRSLFWCPSCQPAGA